MYSNRDIYDHIKAKLKKSDGQKYIDKYILQNIISKSWQKFTAI